MTNAAASIPHMAQIVARFVGTCESLARVDPGEAARDDVAGMNGAARLWARAVVGGGLVLGMEAGVLKPPRVAHRARL
jgi:hypothetical protein